MNAAADTSPRSSRMSGGHALRYEDLVALDLLGQPGGRCAAAFGGCEVLCRGGPRRR